MLTHPSSQRTIFAKIDVECDEIARDKAYESKILSWLRISDVSPIRSCDGITVDYQFHF